MQRAKSGHRWVRRLMPLLLGLAVIGGVTGWQVSSSAGVLERTPLTPVGQAKGSQSVWMEVTAYCPCKVCCGRRARGITASGKSVRHNGGRFVAADTDVLPFNTLVSIPGYHDGTPVPVIDTGSDIVGYRLDVFFPSHEAAEAWGRKMLRVRISSAR